MAKTSTRHWLVTLQAEGPFSSGSHPIAVGQSPAEHRAKAFHPFDLAGTTSQTQTGASPGARRENNGVRKQPDHRAGVSSFGLEKLPSTKAATPPATRPQNAEPIPNRVAPDAVARKVISAGSR